MKVLITGANGFLGKNLRLHLEQRSDVQVINFMREDGVHKLPALLQEVDFVFHLAGVNRPQDPQEFVVGNAQLTQAMCDAIATIVADGGRKIPIVYASSVQVDNATPYGQSKRAAEEALQVLADSQHVPVHIFRLPNVFGKWCKPNYNSVVATFCHNIAHGLPIRIDDPDAALTLVYVDDVVEHFLRLMDGASLPVRVRNQVSVCPNYETTVGKLASLIQGFKDSRKTLQSGHVGTGLERALHATYLSYLPVEAFAYEVPQYGDLRGVFVEMLKTPDSGQFSYFTVHPGMTRGGHYHHSKTEKFLVVKGQAHFRFRHVLTGQTHELVTDADKPQIVETVPGWTHDITNTGQDEMIVMLWANEAFNPARPDTFYYPL
jgi:UDP-2-acetamido-2,6-beta-L-arabino-hexul-4-ose reductase